jgi:phospholipid/cholesterol/gamma-HCH transport system substrate-binding protein
MNHNKKAVTVGIFVFLGLVIFIVGVLTLGGQKKTFERKVHVKAVFEDVGGLQKGSNVWFSGVKVGTVKEISFTDNSKVEVVMSIETKVQKYIRKDAKAKVSSEGFIGNKIIVIYEGTASAPVIAENDMLKVEKGLSTDEIMATFQENNKNLVEITGNFKLISERLVGGEGSIGKLLSDETLVNSLQMAVNRLNLASANAQQLTADISKYAAALRLEGSLTNDLVTDTVIFSSLRATVLQLQNASTTANAITDNIKLASNNIKQTSDNLNSTKSPAGVLLNDPEAGKNLKTTLANLEASTKKLDENMEAMQHNFLLRGFFKKKKKHEEKNQLSGLKE